MAATLVKIDYLPNDQIEKTGKNSLENEVNLIISSIVNAVAKSPFLLQYCAEKIKEKWLIFALSRNRKALKERLHIKVQQKKGREFSQRCRRRQNLSGILNGILQTTAQEWGGRYCAAPVAPPPCAPRRTVLAAFSTNLNQLPKAPYIHINLWNRASALKTISDDQLGFHPQNLFFQ